jgi:hypothetical protein
MTYTIYMIYGARLILSMTYNNTALVAISLQNRDIAKCSHLAGNGLASADARG